MVAWYVGSCPTGHRLACFLLQRSYREEKVGMAAIGGTGYTEVAVGRVVAWWHV